MHYRRLVAYLCFYTKLIQRIISVVYLQWRAYVCLGWLWTYGIARVKYCKYFQNNFKISKVWSFLQTTREFEQNVSLLYLSVIEYLCWYLYLFFSSTKTFLVRLKFVCLCLCYFQSNLTSSHELLKYNIRAWYLVSWNLSYKFLWKVTTNLSI